MNQGEIFLWKLFCTLNVEVVSGRNNWSQGVFYRITFVKNHRKNMYVGVCFSNVFYFSKVQKHEAANSAAILEWIKDSCFCCCWQILLQSSISCKISFQCMTNYFKSDNALSLYTRSFVELWKCVLVIQLKFDILSFHGIVKSSRYGKFDSSKIALKNLNHILRNSLHLFFQK